MPHIVHIATTQLRGIPPLEIDIAPAQGRPFRHLVLTGPNGTGKTSVLGAIAAQVFTDTLFGAPDDPDLARDLAVQSVQAGQVVFALERRASFVEALPFGHASLRWLPELATRDPQQRESVVFSYLPARRGIEIEAVSAISTENELPRKGAFEAESPGFLQFLVNRKAQQSFARDDGDESTARVIEQWFDNLNKSLARLFDEDQLHLEFDRKTLGFYLTTGGRRDDIRQLAHGHAAALGVLAEVLMRVELSSEELGNEKGKERSGVILIDEPEMHLHLELQERILPALVDMFPRIQFIVATHSPAIVSSIDDAIVFDLEDRQPRNSSELRGRSYGWIMKRHFGLEEDFDLATTAQLQELDRLRRIEAPTDDQQARLEFLAEKLSSTSHGLALEVWNRILTNRLQLREGAE